MNSVIGNALSVQNITTNHLMGANAVIKLSEVYKEL